MQFGSLRGNISRVLDFFSKIFRGSPRASENPPSTPSPSRKIGKGYREAKGDLQLLDGKDAVSFRTAVAYLGISDRQRQRLIKRGILDVEGMGQNRRITTESLRKYLPPSKKSDPKRLVPNSPDI